MKRRLIAALVSLALTLHGALPMAAEMPATTAPAGSLAAALLVICTPAGAVDTGAPAKNHGTHDCPACPAPCHATALAPAGIVVTLPVVRAATVPLAPSLAVRPVAAATAVHARAPPHAL